MPASAASNSWDFRRSAANNRSFSIPIVTASAQASIHARSAMFHTCGTLSPTESAPTSVSSARSGTVAHARMLVAFQTVGSMARSQRGWTRSYEE